MKACRRVEMPLHTLPTSALFESEWSAWRPGRIMPVQIVPTAPPELLNFQGRSGRVWEHDTLLLLPGVEPPSSVLLPHHFAKRAALVNFVRLLYIIVVILTLWAGRRNELSWNSEQRRRFGKILCGRSGAPPGYGI
jgi:hypothetical protein